MPPSQNYDDTFDTLESQNNPLAQVQSALATLADTVANLSGDFTLIQNDIRLLQEQAEVAAVAEDLIRIEAEVEALTNIVNEAAALDAAAAAAEAEAKVDISDAAPDISTLISKYGYTETYNALSEEDKTTFAARLIAAVNEGMPEGVSLTEWEKLSDEQKRLITEEDYTMKFEFVEDGKGGYITKTTLVEPTKNAPISIKRNTEEKSDKQILAEILGVVAKNKIKAMASKLLRKSTSNSSR
jgi:Ca2+-binding EF-hand superfamily protein